MSFQINALPQDAFAPLFKLSEADLKTQRASRLIVEEASGTPCRVSLKDAEVGETVLLVNFTHLDQQSPFAASHAIFVREGARQAELAINEVPEMLSSRMLSLRGFDANHMMLAADLVDGQALSDALRQVFEDPDIAYIHIHFAKPGCFTAQAMRAPN